MSFALRNFRWPRKNQSGFTLLEILLVVGLLVAVAGLSVPIYQSFQVTNDLDIAVNTIAQSSRRAQILAQSGEGDKNWGIYMDSSIIVVFRGDAYAGRPQVDQDLDEEFDVPATITIPQSEVVFSKISGDPNTTIAITVTASNGNTREVSINEVGMVEY